MQNFVRVVDKRGADDITIILFLEKQVNMYNEDIKENKQKKFCNNQTKSNQIRSFNERNGTREIKHKGYTDKEKKLTNTRIIDINANCFRY